MIVAKHNHTEDVLLDEVNLRLRSGEEYTVPELDTMLWRESQQVIDAIDNEHIIINNGNEDLDKVVGKEHVLHGVKKVTEEMEMLSGGGANAPALDTLGADKLVLSVNIGDIFFSSKKFNNIVGSYVQSKFYMCVNNSDSDKWGQANVRYTSTTGCSDKSMNTNDGSITIGPVEVPTTPYLPFCASVILPSSILQNGETILFISVERETPTGKDSFTGPFFVLKYEVDYWARVEA